MIPRAPAGKILATIVELHGGDERSAYTHAFALDAEGVRYFIFWNAVERTSAYTLDDFQIGTQVMGTPIRHPKGMRLLEVQVREI